MNSIKNTDLILKINRPQYVPFSEIFISEIAWRLANLPGWTENIEIRNRETGKNKSKGIGLVYDSKIQNEETENLVFVATRPDITPDYLRIWVRVLEQNRFNFLSGDQSDSARSVADAMRGVQVDKSKRQAATPLSPHIALLQNRQGIFGKKAPIDIGLIIEQIFALGDPEIENYEELKISPSDSASSLWYLAMRTRLHDDYELARIDASVRDFIQQHPYNLDPNRIVEKIFPDINDPELLMKPRIEMTQKNQVTTIFLGEQTPFFWFHKAWTSLTSERWIKALPARRWTDWATTVLRVAFGFSYIWDANWYLALASTITSSETESNVNERCLYSSRSENQTKEKVTVDFILRSPRLVSNLAMHWKDSDSSVSTKDVAQSVRLTLSRGLQVRKILDDFYKTAGEDLTLEEALFALHSDVALRQSLIQAQKGKFNSNANSLWEAVKYSLMARSGSGDMADFYGLLRSRNRKFLIIDPATEWMAVISSLAIDSPDGIGDLGKVRTELARLGLQPSVRELTKCLEAAGLAQSAADADIAVSVKSAF